MKYKMAFIITSIVVMISIVMLIAFNVQRNAYKAFVMDGYILSTKGGNNYDSDVPIKYYFSAGTKLKDRYPEKVTFLDTNNNKVFTSNTDFVHYTDGSISVLKKSVIIDLDGLNSELLKYYNVFDVSLLENANGDFYIDNLGAKIKFTNFVLKVSDSKYLIVSKNLKLKLNSTEEVTVSDYIELNFFDGNIVRLENQEATYQTISSDSYIKIGNDTKINLEDRNISVNDKPKLTLNQLVIDSDDNIQIMPQKEKQPDGSNGSNTNNGSNNGSTSGPNGNNGGNTSSGDNGSQSSSKLPSFSIVNMEVTSNKIDASIKITDDDGLLTDSVFTKIIEDSTGKTVYFKEETSGAYDLEVLVENLTPDLNYTLIMTSDYVKDGVTYTRDFVSRTFRTEVVGIYFTKDYFTKNKVSFTVRAESYSKVQNVKMALFDEKDQIIKTVDIDGEAAKAADGVNVLFDNLQADTNYTAKMYNFLYDGSIILTGFEIKYNCRTLKNKPTFGATSFIIDKKNSSFTLKVNNISDVNNGISNYKYEIYDARTLLDSDSSPLAVVEKSKWSSVDLPVDSVSIFRGVPYTFKLVTEFYDNEKYIEYESEYSDVFKMDGVEFPSVRFNPSNVTFERIEGNLVITDVDNTVKLDDNIITVVYTDSTGNSNSFTTSGNLSIPLSLNGLRANETYTISVYTAINLQDGNQTIDSCYIGSAVVKTKEPQKLLTTFNVDKNNVTSVFTVNTQLGAAEGVNNTLEASTLTGITFNLYAGQDTTGTIVKSIKDVDKNLQPYESDLKSKYYDKTFEITPRFFGIRNEDLQDDYYTIQIVNAYDYTNYKNNIPIAENTVTLKSNGFIPDLPADPNDCIEVSPIRNKDGGDKNRAGLNPDTIIGYRVRAGFDNAQLYAKYLVYYVHNADTNKVILSDGTRVDVDESGKINYIDFYLGDGTNFDTIDNDFRRGNNYYFTYEAYLDLNLDGVAETKYPYTGDGTATPIELRSAIVSPAKQQPSFQLYPSTSTSNTMTWKYKFSDIDKALVGNYFYPKMDGSGNGSVPITETVLGGDFASVQLSGLTTGNLGIYVKQALLKGDGGQDRNLVYQHFDGSVSMPNLKFHVGLEVNRLIISIVDYENNSTYVDRIAGLKATFVTSTQTIVKDNLTIENGNAVVDLGSINQLIGQDVSVSVQAYYDTGITGFDTIGNFFALQTIQNTNGGGDYLTLNSDLNFRTNRVANGSIYTTTFTPTSLNLVNKVSNLSKNISLVCDMSGISYNYEYLLLKRLDLLNITGDGSQTIRFNMIIPGVSLLDTKGKLNITPALRTTDVRIQVYGNNASAIKDNVMYVELYQTDETGTTSTFIREINVAISPSGNLVTISGLNPKTQYYITLFADVYNGTEYTRQKLYDIDFNSPSKIYYFATLSSVGITNVSASYVATNYNDKAINVTYNLDRIIGFDKMKYELYRYATDENGHVTKVPVNVQISNDIVFQSSMTKEIDCLPGSDIVFDEDYNLVITPIASITIDGVTREIELDNVVSYDFHLNQLRLPFVGITGIVLGNSNLEFKISISDIDKVIVDGIYTIKVLNDQGNDVTPEAYKFVEYPITTLNNTVTLNTLNKGAQYTLVIITYDDLNNSMTDVREVTTTYSKNTLDNSGIDIGSIYSTMNTVNRSQIDLSFYNSYKLTDITNIRYSIYNLNGYAQDNLRSFIPTQVNTGSNVYYYITLPERLPVKDVYYIEIQFIVNGKIIKQVSVEHHYTGS